MRRLLCMVLTGAVMIGCMCTGTGAVDESNVVSYSFETTGTAITRATGCLLYTSKQAHLQEQSFLYKKASSQDLYQPVSL